MVRSKKEFSVYCRELSSLLLLILFHQVSMIETMNSKVGTSEDSEGLRKKL